MKRFIFTLLIVGAFGAFALDYVIYNPVSDTVTNRVVATNRSVSALPSLPSGHAALIYGKASVSNWNGVLPNVPMNWMKVSNNLVVPMTEVESNSIVSAQAITEAAAAIAALQAAAMESRVQATGQMDNFYTDPYVRRDLALRTVFLNLINNHRTNAVPALAPISEAAVNAALRAILAAQPTNAP